MPAKMWKFHCGCQSESVLLAVPNCDRCGAPGECDGWHLLMMDAMAAYQKVYGLKPIGSHRDYARTVMCPLFRLCEVCSGRGVLALPGEDACCRCPLCDGTLRVSNVSRKHVLRARQQVLAVFPDAGAEPWE